MRTKNSKYASNQQRSTTAATVSSNVNKNSISDDFEASELPHDDSWMSRHPESWTREEVAQWINWCTHEFSLPKIAKGKLFEMNGRGLMMLTVDMFKERVPHSGDILYSALTSLLPVDQQHKRQAQQDAATSKKQPSDSIKPDFSLIEKDRESPKQQQSTTSSTPPPFPPLLHQNSGASKSSALVYSPTACSKATKTTSKTHIAQSTSSSCSLTSATTASHNNENENDDEELCTTVKNEPTPHQHQLDSSSKSPKRTRSNSNEQANSLHSDKEMKETAILSSFVPNQSNCKENDESNSNEMNQRKRHLSPTSAAAVAGAVAGGVIASPTSNFERKRTLENLVDTLKVRKQNQTSPGAYKSKAGTSTASASADGKMSSIYVDIAASMSDCSPSTPPLSSSPSVSPSSLSIPPDSPGHVSSFSSSTSSVANLINQALAAAAVTNRHNNRGIVMPKSRWMFDFSSEIGVVVGNDTDANHNSMNAKSSSSSSSSSSYTASSSKSSSPSSSTLNSKSSPKRIGVNSNSAVGITDSLSAKAGGIKNEANANDEELLADEEAELDKDDIEEEELDNGNEAQWNQAEQMDDETDNLMLDTGDEPEMAANAEYNEDIEDEEVEEEDDDDSYVESKKGKPAAKGRAASAPAAAKLKGAARGVGAVGKGVQGDSKVKFYDDYIDFKGDILRRPPNSKNCRILWEYLYLLLQNTNYTSVIRWEDETNMVFRIVQAEKLASLWGLQKNRLGMTYEKLSRGMRYYYPNNIIAREPGRRLLYRFMRHPDDIKKCVKKDGKYMLKRGKGAGKNGADSTNGYEDETGSFDEDSKQQMENSRKQLPGRKPQAVDTDNSLKTGNISNIIKFNKKLVQQQNDNKNNHSRYQQQQQAPARGGKPMPAAAKFNQKSESDYQNENEDNDYNNEGAEAEYDDGEGEEAESSNVDENNNYVNNDEDDDGAEQTYNGNGFFNQAAAANSANNIFEHYKQNFKNFGDNNMSQLARFMPDLGPLYQQLLATAAAQMSAGSYMSRFNDSADAGSITNQLLYHLRNQAAGADSSTASSTTNSTSSSNGANNLDNNNPLVNQFLINETIKNFSNSINLQRPSAAKTTTSSATTYNGQTAGAKLKRPITNSKAPITSTSNTTSSSSSSSRANQDASLSSSSSSSSSFAKYMPNFLLEQHQHALNLSNKKRKNKNDIN